MSVVRSSVIASAKYSCSESLLRLVNGSTTIDNRGAEYGGTVRRAAGVAVSSCTLGPGCRADHIHQAPLARAPNSSATNTGTSTCRRSEGCAGPAAGAQPFELVAIV